MPTTQLKARSRVTLFPLEDLTVAYTTQSGDPRGLGDIAVIAVTGSDSARGDDLWILARSMWGRVSNGQEQARWILTQAVRARLVGCDAYADLPDAEWAADLDRTVRLEGLFANHETLCTGRFLLLA
ncbi:hypothetical protein [Streptomyces sp. SCSIO 30461]|uniref:hypothetical protein n=1 Tax=Streptomyces sp. SCSIO 30461 TaxID=3118085 RepID=UPI00387E5D6B